MFPRINPITGTPYKKNTKTDTTKNIDPPDIYFDLLSKDPNFDRMKGRCKFLDPPEHMKRPFGDFWRFNDPEIKDGGAIVLLPTNLSLTDRVFIKIMFVPTELSGKGIARRAMKALTNLCDDTQAILDDRQLAKEQYGHITRDYISLTLVPNSFWVNEEGDYGWRLNEDDSLVNWSDEDHATEQGDMADETVKSLPPHKRRISWQKLRTFYRSCGFAVCKGLSWTENFLEQEYTATLTKRSLILGRHQMIYPSKHAKIYGEGPTKRYGELY